MSRPFADESVFRAVAHPVRRRMLEMLRVRERPVGELLEPFPMAKQTLSHHLRILRTSGLIQQRRVGRGRVYAIASLHLKDLHKWIAAFEDCWKPKAAR